MSVVVKSYRVVEAVREKRGAKEIEKYRQIGRKFSVEDAARTLCDLLRRQGRNCSVESVLGDDGVEG